MMDNANLSQLSDIELVKLNALYDNQIQQIDNQISNQKEIYKSIIEKVKDINNKKTIQ